MEPANARRAGVDLVDALLNVALGRTPVPQPVGRVGVATHQLLLAVLGAAQARRARLGVLRELYEAAAHPAAMRAASKSSRRCAVTDTLLIPVTTAALATLAWPRSWRFFSSGAGRELRAQPRRLEGHRVHPTAPPSHMNDISPCRYGASPSAGTVGYSRHEVGQSSSGRPEVGPGRPSALSWRDGKRGRPP